jgi:hypothetical protein
MLSAMESPPPRKDRLQKEKRTQLRLDGEIACGRRSFCNLFVRPYCAHIRMNSRTTLVRWTLGRMFYRFLPFLIGLAVLVMLDSKASASFVSPDALPEAKFLWSGAAQSGASLPAQEDSRSGFWHKVFYFGFLLFAQVSEFSPGAHGQAGTGSFERPPLPQASFLADQKTVFADIVTWIVREKMTLMMIPYAGRLFRPPRTTVYPEQMMKSELHLLFDEFYPI